MYWTAFVKRNKHQSTVLEQVREHLLAVGLIPDADGEEAGKIMAFITAATVAGQPKAELVTDITDIAVAALSRHAASTCWIR